MPLLHLGRRLARLARTRRRIATRRRLAQRPVRVRVVDGAKPSAPDTDGGPVIDYSPTPDGAADPGEVVWTWVPYEEDATQGKDRPVLVIGRCDESLVGLMLTSQDHDRDAEQEAQEGRFWMDVGTGDWDRSHRPSEVRLNRLIRVDDTCVRREGAALDRGMFDAVVTAARPYFRSA